jgi:anti-anti-sigma factor
MVKTLLKEHQLTIFIDGKFAFNLHKDIRKAYEMIDDSVEEVIVDFEKVNDLDSSAIAMLLQIKERCPQNRVLTKIVGCNEEMKTVLCIFSLNDTYDIS